MKRVHRGEGSWGGDVVIGRMRVGWRVGERGQIRGAWRRGVVFF